MGLDMGGFNGMLWGDNDMGGFIGMLWSDHARFCYRIV